MGWWSYYNLISDKDILALTALSVFIYTGLTWLLWRATKRQTDILHTPYLVLRFSNEDKKSNFYIKNIGNDIATKICLEGERILVTDRNMHFEVKFDTVEMLEAGTEKSIRYKVFENGKRSAADDFAIYFFSLAAIKKQSPFDSEKQRKRRYIRITFNNIFGKKYYYKTYIEDGEYRVKKFGQNSFFKQVAHELFLFLQGLKVKVTVFIKRRLHEQKKNK